MFYLAKTEKKKCGNTDVIHLCKSISVFVTSVDLQQPVSLWVVS